MAGPSPAMTAQKLSVVIASDSEAIQSFEGFWITSAYAQRRFGGLQARQSSRGERRRVVVSLPCANALRLPQAMTKASICLTLDSILARRTDLPVVPIRRSRALL
jgi:hypothetical protein